MAKVEIKPRSHSCRFALNSGHSLDRWCDGMCRFWYIRFSRCVTSVDGKVVAKYSIMAAAAATGADATRATDVESTGFANLHCPVAAATSRHRRCNGLATTEHHIRAVWRGLHPRLPRACLALATDCNILGNSARWAAMFPETRVIETIAVSHVIGVLQSKCVERRTIGMA